MKKRFHSFLSSLIFSFIILSVFISPSFAAERLSSIKQLPALNKSATMLEINANQEIKNQIVIMYKNPGQDNIGALGLNKDDYSAGKQVSDTIDVLEVKSQEQAESLIEIIKQNDNVLSADYEGVAQADGIPNDKFYKYQNYYSRIGADKIWDTAQKGSQAKVAILDTGISDSSDLTGRLEKSGYNYVSSNTDTSDDQGHGTAIAGIIAANTNNGDLIAGITGNTNVSVVPYKVLDSSGNGNLSDIVAAIRTVLSRDDIKVINMSFGYNLENQVLKSTVEMAIQNGKILVASSGNTEQNYLLYPAKYPEVIAVGAVDENDQRCTPATWGKNNGSSYGENIDFVAPGNRIATLKYDIPTQGTYLSGTSFSAPMVSGAVLLALTKDPGLTPAQISDYLVRSAEDIGTPGYDLETGYGIVRIDRLYQMVPYKENSGTLSLQTKNLLMLPGESAQIEYKASAPVKWISSDSSVASVSNGTVTAHKPGNIIITAQLADDPKINSTCRVVVSENLTYSAHVANIGWMPAVSQNQIAGTTGRSLAMEALRITAPAGLTITGSAHIQNIGWTGWTTGEFGTTGRALQMEGLKLRLEGEKAGQYDLYYKSHVQNYGWTEWVKAEQPTGSQGKALRIEAVKVVLVPKGSAPPFDSADVVWGFMQ